MNTELKRSIEKRENAVLKEQRKIEAELSRIAGKELSGIELIAIRSLVRDYEILTERANRLSERYLELA